MIQVDQLFPIVHQQKLMGPPSYKLVYRPHELVETYQSSRLLIYCG